jgi:hypothetical protein
MTIGGDWRDAPDRNKDPGFAVDVTFAGNIRDFVAVCLGCVEGRDVGRTTLPG